jgi:hypothetical protein
MRIILLTLVRVSFFSSLSSSSFQMSDEFYCKICDIKCTGKAPYEQHIISAKHKKKSSSIQTTVSDVNQWATTNTSCHPMNLMNKNDSSLTSRSVTISHETMRILLEWNHPRDYPPYCDICHLPLHGENAANYHYQSNNQIHQAKLINSKLIRDKKPAYSCFVCCEIFDHADNMETHLRSKEHADLVQRKNDLEKFIEIYRAYEKLKRVRSNRINTS